MSKNYSHSTSKPAFKSNADGKKTHCELILNIFKELEGKACLLQIQQQLQLVHNIHLPQSSVAGRVGQLRQRGLVEDTGGHVSYENLKRRLFSLTTNKLRKSTPKKIKAIKPKPVAPAMASFQQTSWF